MIIDSHIHFPFGCETQPNIGRHIVELAEKCGIGICVVSHLFGEKMGDNMHFPVAEGVSLANRFAARQAAMNPGRLFFMGYINPQNPGWEEEMQRCIQEGACGIKLWVSLKDKNGSMENTIQVLRQAAKMKMAVYLHVYNRTGGTLPGELCIDDFMELAKAVPECRMIAGHTGGNWRRSVEAIKHLPDNVWMETGGSGPDYGMVDGILTFCPPERLLFGSDAMGRAFFPQIWKYLESSLSPAERELVFFKNAMELLDLPQPPEGDLPQIPPSPEKPETDYCCFCGKYPFEKRPENSPAQLENILEQEGIANAFTAYFDAIFAQSPTNANREFLEQCKNLARVKPLAVLNLNSPDRERTLQDIASDSTWSGIWISPAFHLWRLDDPAHADFLRKCASLAKPVFLNCGLYDPRFFHPDVRFRPVSSEELQNFLNASPFELNVIQGAYPPDGTGASPRQLWCYTLFADKGRGMPKNVNMVRGSEYPFRHIHETYAAFTFANKIKAN